MAIPVLFCCCGSKHVHVIDPKARPVEVRCQDCGHLGKLDGFTAGWGWGPDFRSIVDQARSEAFPS